jgi:hypothetical protein
LKIEKTKNLNKKNSVKTEFAIGLVEQKYKEIM